MKILSAEQIREADAYTIKHEPISSTDLMERAATACYHWLAHHYATDTHFTVFCGIGNNGGDGLVIARLLAQNGYDVKTIVVDFSNKHAQDFTLNEERLLSSGQDINYVKQNDELPELLPHTIVVDAIFGTGLNKAIQGFPADVVNYINAQHLEVVAVDMPSGCFADDISTDEAIVKATHTLSFQWPKLSFLFPETAAFVGQWHILDIGLHEDFIQSCFSPFYYLDKHTVQGLLTIRDKFSHKGTYGHALIIAGSKGKMGAAALSTKACLRSGAGLVSVFVPECGYTIMQTSVPEAMVFTDKDNSIISDIYLNSDDFTLGLGPGLGTDELTASTLLDVVRKASKPMVLDADALNILAKYPDALNHLPENSILTPHPKEFERLAGKSENSLEQLENQRIFSEKYRCIIVLKGAHTAIALPDGTVYFNATGNPGMATGGSGDVLTGIITGLLAQHYTPEHAAIAGVYLHGLAGDIAKEDLGENALIASDIIAYLPKAFKAIK